MQGTYVSQFNCNNMTNEKRASGHLAQYPVNRLQ